jgi:hypothetical protein
MMENPTRRVQFTVVARNLNKLEFFGHPKWRVTAIELFPNGRPMTAIDNAGAHRRSAIRISAEFLASSTESECYLYAAAWQLADIP